MTEDVENQKQTGEKEPMLQNTNVKKKCSDVISLLMTSCLVVVAVIVPVFMIIVGSLHVGDCPIEEWIPIYLIGAGTVEIILIPVTLILTNSKVYSESCRIFTKYFCGIFALLFYLFTFGWFIAGNVWVFRIYGKRSACDALTYQFAFWSIIVTYVMALYSCCIHPVGKKVFTKN